MKPKVTPPRPARIDERDRRISGFCEAIVCREQRRVDPLWHLCGDEQRTESTVRLTPIGEAIAILPDASGPPQLLRDRHGSVLCRQNHDVVSTYEGFGLDKGR